MKPPKTIVSEGLLREFVEGKLDSAMQVKVAAFIEKHPHLLAKVEAISSTGFLAKVRSAHHETEPVAQEPTDESPMLELLPSKPVEPSRSFTEEIPEELRSFTGYRIVRELGRGGMGVVYLAKNVQLGGRDEVLKVLNERLLRVPEAKDRFQREIFAVSQLKHPAIVTAYSVLPLPNLLVFAMEFVDGKDLASLIRDQHPLPPVLVCSIIQQVAAGLRHGHESGLVHRDIKPSNIMVYRSENKLGAKILDYGLAKPTNEKPTEGMTQDGVMMGTVEYIAPEQILDAARADHLSDIYSLGCTFYHALTGRPPFVGTMREQMASHWHAEATLVHLLRPEIPDILSAIVAKMMAKEPTKRFASAAELMKALKPFLKPSAFAAKSASQLAGPVLESTHETNIGLAKPNIDTSVDGLQPHLAHSDAKAALSPLAHSYGRGGEDSPIEPATVSQLLSVPARPNPRTRSTKRLWIGLGMACLLAFIGYVWLGGMLTIKTPSGTLIIENLPQDAEVEVDGKRVHVAWNATKSKAEILLSAGSHEVRVKRDEQVIESPTFIFAADDIQSWSVPESPNSTEQSEPDNKGDKIGAPKAFSFLDDTPVRNVSVEEKMAYEDAVKTRRQLTNGNFKEGLEGWETIGGANFFAYHPGMQSDGNHLTTWGKHENWDTGRLFQCFEIPTGVTHLVFYIHGGNKRETQYVALAYRDKEVIRATGPGTNEPYRVEWRVKELQGEVVTLEIVDLFCADSWTHIGVEDFKFKPERP